MAWRLSIVVLAMFGFGYALVPLYDVLCDITGLNGTTGMANAAVLDTGPDLSRTVRVQFMSTVNSQLAWDFRPLQTTMDVHPGHVYETAYEARNLLDAAVAGQAVPSVAPLEAAVHFNKTDCFCFTKQERQPGEVKTMPVRFIIGRNLPPGVKTVTLSYTFFKAEPAS